VTIACNDKLCESGLVDLSATSDEGEKVEDSKTAMFLSGTVQPVKLPLPDFQTEQQRR
jgi:hypothetical protein